MLDCPSDELVAAFVDGDGLSAEVRAELHRHIVDCPTCLSLVGEVARSLPTAGTTPAIPPAGSPEGSLAWDVIGDISGRQVGPYQLVCLLGRGAMGAVYRARDTTLKRDVAIKFINAGKTGDEMRQRFLREARAVAQLRHENVIMLFGVGEVEGVPYQVSEYVDGCDLSHLPLPLSPDQVLRIALDLSAGLAAAHAKGVIHRDLKPSNVMFSEDSRAKLVDFGLARFLEASPDSQSAKTQSGALVGTPRYMAPEALRGQAATPQSDIFSLGLLLCELATGHLPEPGETVKFPQQMDPRLGRCLARCLDLDPARRFPNGAAFHAALSAPRRQDWYAVAAIGAAALLLSAGGYAAYLHRQVDEFKSVHAASGATCAMTFMTQAPVVGCGIFQDFERKTDVVYGLWQDPAAIDHNAPNPAKIEYLFRSEKNEKFLHVIYASSKYYSNIALRGSRLERDLVMDIGNCRKIIWRLRSVNNKTSVGIRLTFMDGSIWEYRGRFDSSGAKVAVNKPNEWIDLEFDLSPKNWYPFPYDGRVSEKEHIEFSRQDRHDRIVTLVRLVFEPESGALDIGPVRFVK